MNFLIRNVKLIDGTGTESVPRVNVAVQEGVISWIDQGPIRHFEYPHYEDINGEDLTLVPGLFDCHEHFAGDGGQFGVSIMADESDDIALIFSRAVSNARRALIGGQTSARDVGSPHGISIKLAKAIAAGAIEGPRITASGEWLQMPTTWGYSFVKTVNSKEAMEAAVKDQISQGAGLIKVGATGTNSDGTSYSTLGLDICRLVVDLAHNSGLKAAAHCTDGIEGTWDAVNAGFDSIEHAVHVDDRTASLMKNKGTYSVPTLSTWDYRIRAANRWKSPRNERDAAEGRKWTSIASTKRCIKAGVKIAAGTDAGGSPVRHGSIVRELELLVEVGLTPMEALQASTKTAAELVGNQNLVGTIEVGKQADMLLLDGDPLEDIASLRNIWAMFLGGRRIR